MKQTYELMDTIYHHYLNENQALFLHQFNGFLSEISMSELYEAIRERLTTSDSEDVKGLLNGRDYLVFHGEQPSQSLYVSVDEPLDQQVVELLGDLTTYQTMTIWDRFYRYNQSTVIYFNEDEQTFLFSHRFMNDHDYLLIKNGEVTANVSQQLEHCAYLLLLLSTLADLFFQFEA